MRAIHAQLTAAFPAHDRALLGQHAILRWFHAFGIRRLNTGPLTWRIVNTWRVKHGCPILRGFRTAHAAGSPLSTSYALTAWVLSAFTTGDLFNVVSAHPDVTAGSSPASKAA